MTWYPLEVYEEHYLASDDPRRQSGFGGDEERWEAARRPIAEAVDHDGSFLDVGCANGYLLESIVRWSEHRLEPYGLDFSPRLVERLLERAVAPGGRLIVCGYGSPRSGIPAHPVRRILRAWGSEPELEVAAGAPEGGGPIVELAVLGVAPAP